MTPRKYDREVDELAKAVRHQRNNERIQREQKDRRAQDRRDEKAAKKGKGK